jgi:hypothetical protein
MNTIRIEDEIIAAFADVPYSGDDRLTVYLLTGREFDETYQLLHGRHWREMPVVEFMNGDTPIPDLTSEAFHFYIPALLLASLDTNFELYSDVAFTVAYTLSPSSARNTVGKFQFDHTDEYNRRMSLFTISQRAAMIRVLEEYVRRGCEASEDVQRTIDRLRG